MADNQQGVPTADQQSRPATIQQMREWLRTWVANTTGLDAAEISDERSMQDFGLSSRDVVVLSGDLERLLGTTLDATIAYEFNTIAALAEHLMQGRGSGAVFGGDATTSAGAASSAGGPLPLGQRDIAVVGMAGRYPGADSADEMWELFSNYCSGVGELPAGRWSEYSRDPEMTRRMEQAQLTGGYIEDIASFDAEFFGLSPLEAANMDPQQRIILQLTWEALEDAHIPANQLRGKPVGVFMGNTNNDYGMLISADPAEAHPYALTGNSSSIIANRVSYAFDFRGPSVAMDTACSSSLVAIHQAVRSLRDGDSEVAVAGGVNLLCSPFATVAFSELGVLSPTGGIRAFSDDADGIVRSDGAGVVVLKRLEDARRDGDNVLAVIKGSAVNSDGRSNGLTAPNPDAQVDVLRSAYADARIDPQAVDYVEAHGTGTILGDPIEATALGTVLGRQRDVAEPLLLGSAKTNFGHTEAAAGVAGVMKVVLAMREGVLPPSLNYTGPNPYIDFDREHLEVVEDPREWPEYSGRAIAGVSGFGFGGTNAHVVIASPDLEEEAAAGIGAGGANSAAPIGLDREDSAGEAPRVLLPVSGLLPSRRRQAAEALATYLEQNKESFTKAGDEADQLRGVALALAGHNHGRSRGVVSAATFDEAIAGLQRIAAGKQGATVKTADSPAANGPVWVFSGFGSQHRKMAKDLYGLSEFFAARLDELDQVVLAESGWSFVEMVLDDEQNYDTERAQVGITCVQIALNDLMRALGAKPAAVVGQSMGEIAAAYAVGGITAEEAVRTACHRARLMGEGERLLPEDKQGAMAVVEFGVEELATFTSEHPEYAKVEPAVYAAPGMTTVGGPAEPVQKLVEYLESEGKFARLLKVKGAGHTSMLDPILGELHYEISDLDPQPIHTPLYSTVDRGRVYQPGEVVHDAEYFLRCTRQPVWFSEATGKQFDDGYRTFIEFSPNPVALMPLMNNSFAHNASDSKLMFLLKRKEPVAQTLLSTLAELYVQGADLDLKALAGGPRATLPKVPGTQWNLQRHWTNARPSSGPVVDLPGTRVDLPDGRVVFSVPAEDVPSIELLAEAAAEVLADGATVAATREHAPLPTAGQLTTIAAGSLGGWSLSVYAADAPGAQSMPLVAEAFVATLGGAIGGLGAASTEGTKGTDAASASAAAKTSESPAASASAASAKESAGNTLPEVDESADRWDPNSGESAGDRLRAIVSESMGYDIEDLPGELPLIDLGLDSLMGMRIKNRVEYDFDLPPLQVQALRDGSVDDVIALVEQMIAERHANADRADAAGADTADSAEAAAGGEGGVTGEEDGAATDYTATGGGVAPRDASERLVFATWAKVTGKAAQGVTSQLPGIDEEQARGIADRLTERSGAEVSAEDVLAAETLEPLSEKVRSSLESEVEGNIRVLRSRPEGSTQPAVFLFHPAGGSSVVYAPLMRRLPDDVPVYGVERLEGELADRAAAYLEEIIELADGRPVLLGGWSFGGALAYEVAHQLGKRAAAGEPSAEVERIVLLDTVQPKNPAPDTKEEMHARWDRYAAFAQKTYGLPLEVPHELLDQQGEGVMMQMFQQFLTSPEAKGMGLPAGVLEHQRASFVDNRILESLDFWAWADVKAPVTLFRAERMHDGAIELEPAYAEVAPDGGWGEIVEDLEIVQLRGDHLAIVDEPEISKVGRVIAKHIADGV
ncbi:polyketide synthase Pks13 [Corynebacterium jeikeium]|uniref:Polyketide synthase n=1 Tax=Corynebacterium jeikeium (strain K411) TaxID=306537 RepID=Q4JY17_CORJK|nr:polyketide synthase Pks13 [Corynebacterium jeikeium]EEW16497.1 putative acyl carrier protein [Corynebacterium jeikeium ATCC 43734]OOD29882.1 polyketide synthase [Corynebacterium jeikeium]WCZ52686.1 Phthiocerol/phenolphthiocerol synthesis polyketide synthase type I PpsA [Corynebacterium jeikeium]CAI36290.1 polyketide synthase [Corynebacterium jeikeium K411]SUY82008.1 polyketide synthase [Corynebacterium jeikeium]